MLLMSQQAVSAPFSRIHESTISLKFLGIICFWSLRIQCTLKTSFNPLLPAPGGGGGGLVEETLNSKEENS